MSVTDDRLRLHANGYIPLPLQGKRPDCRKEWQKGTALNEAYIRTWERDFGYASNTGILARETPCLDLDVLNEECVEAMEAHVCEQFEERGYVLPRIGKPPKRAFPFRTDEPFKKIQRVLTATNGASGQKIEFLADGQQFAAFGVHPDTHAPYSWPRGSLLDHKRDDLPYIRQAEAEKLVDELVGIAAAFGYACGPKPKVNGDGHHEPTDVEELTRRILSGEALHDSVLAIAGSYAGRGESTKACIDYVGLAFTAAHQPRYGGRWDECMKAISYCYAKEEAKRREELDVKPATPLEWFNIALDGADVPEHEWAVADRIPLHQVCLMSGHGGTGKSLTCFHLAAAHALGRDWLGSLPMLGGAFFLDAEEDPTEIHIRLEAIRKHYGCSYRDLVEGGLCVLPMAGKDCLMATLSPKTNIVTPTPFYAQVLEQAGDLKPVNIIIANASNVFGGNENDRSGVQQFIGLMKRITNASGGSVTLISHSSLAGLSTETGLSGSTQWHNAVRARMWLHAPKVNGGGEEHQPDSDVRQLDFMKNQYGKLGDGVVLKWRDGMLLPVPAESDFEKAAKADKAERVFLEIARKLQARGQNMSPSKTARNYAAHLVFGELPPGEKTTKPELVAAMNRLLEQGRVVTLTTNRGAYLRIP